MKRCVKAGQIGPKTCGKPPFVGNFGPFWEKKRPPSRLKWVHRMIHNKAKEELISNIRDSVEARLKSDISPKDIADLKRFIETFYNTVHFSEIDEIEPKRLSFIAQSLWQLGEKRFPGSPKVRVFNPDPKKDGWKSPHTCIQIINDDMPFLVDSITGGISNTRGLRIHTVNHPLFVVMRDDNGHRTKTIGAYFPEKGKKEPRGRESIIYLEIDVQGSPEARKELESFIYRILSDVRNSVDDWKKIIKKTDETCENLHKAGTGKEKALFLEAEAFVNWLTDDNFTFLGYREYYFEDVGKNQTVRQDRTTGLGILRDPNRHVMRGPRGMTSESAEVQDFLSHPRPLLITKANIRSLVHRPVHMDYVSVKNYNQNGEPIGERQFVGLFTSQSYMRSPREVPILRKKVKNVQKRSPYGANSHAGKSITHILETFPRDELFLTTERKLLEVALGVLHLLERPRPKVFIREDKYGRYISAIVYVPRESYHSGLRKQIENILCEAYNGEVSVYYASLSEDVLARWHLIIRTKPGKVPKVSLRALNAKIEATSKTWAEGLREELVEKFGEGQGLSFFDKYQGIFSERYKESFEPRRAITDIVHFEGFDVEREVSFEVFREPQDADYVVRLNIYHPSRLIALSEVLPMLENLGVRVISENSYELLTEAGARIHAFYLETPNLGSIKIKKTEELVEPLLEKVWKREIENDYFNALAIHAGLPAQDIVVLRAYAKYLGQLGISYSQALIEQTMFQNPRLPRRLMKLFHVLFEPGKKSKSARTEEADKIIRDIKRHLSQIKSLDQDRIFRMFLAAIKATVRTNFYKNDFQPTAQPRVVGEGENPMPALALKIRTDMIPEAPKPRPFMEIFVSSPRVEGVHLRGGPVARGGIRWSDRREDFRTEVLGLMKAQQVKNAVIVPVGAKGGFFPKNLPVKGTREEIQKEGLASYRIFIRTLLSVTDNLKGTKVIPPSRVFRWDGDDSYFVVAADKGTATFSDQANEIAASTGFWLDDAFASGGSYGYDHKKMGITAKGAWVSVARHFREMGVNIETDTTTVIGIGDMSGDVFGNGMLLSKSMKLVAAFDHRNIFFDPNPDPAASFKERKRLFKKARSSWEDYNPDLISEGGGVFKRSVKSIKLTRALQDFMGLETPSMTPDEVIHNLLKSGADLLWVGGIGTYIKSAREAHIDVGDRANNNIRVNADEIKFQVIGEGGNLGMTQRSRIEFARQGGRLNTDFIDNSAGVDCSDKEVNIKILLASAIENGTLKSEHRNKLLSGMTGEVSDIVLRDNYFQTQAISMAEAEASKKHVQHGALIRRLEKEKRLERALETLPTEDQLLKLALKGRGITRPDLSVLVSHTKLWLKDMLLKSDILEAPILKAELVRSFPETLHVKFSKELESHQLRREIIATNVSNQVVNRAGLTFITEIEEETGLGVDQIVSAFMVARDVFDLRNCWFGIDALDYKVPADLQIQMQTQIAEFLGIQTAWFLKNLKRPINIENGIRIYQESLGRILKMPDRILGPLEQEAFKGKWQTFVINGVPEDLAKKVAAFIVMPKVLDLVNVALKLKRPTEEVGKAYFEVGRVLGFDWLRQTTQNLGDDDHWEYLAANAIIEDLAEQQRDLTHSILGKEKGLSGLKAVESWVKTHPRTRRRTKRLINDIKTSGPITLAKLSFASRHVRSILPRKI